MVKIRMLSDDRGSPNGYEVVEYAAGEVYDVSEGLADAFVRQRKSATLAGAAKAAEQNSAPTPDEAAPELEPVGDDADPDAPAPKKRAKKKADPGE